MVGADKVQIHLGGLKYPVFQITTHISNEHPRMKIFEAIFYIMGLCVWFWLT